MNASLASFLTVGKGAENATTLDVDETKSSIPDGAGFEIPPEMAAKADGMWRMLDDLAETDPAAYKKLIAEAQASGEAQATKGAARKKASSSSRNRSFNPAAGFVAKLRARKVGARGTAEKVFVNCCAHKCIDVPQDHMGHAVKEHDPSINARHIPLLVGPLRTIEDSAGFPAIVVDVVFSPWILAWCCREQEFLQSTATLACQWLLKEHDYSCSGAVAHNVKIIRCRYKGGALDEATGELNPVKFWVTPEGRPAAGPGGDADADADSAAAAPSAPSAATKPMDSPQSLLSSLAAGSAAPTAASTVATGAEGAAARRMPSEATKQSRSAAKEPMLKLKKESTTPSTSLIEEVGAKPKTAQSKKKSKPVVKKGFLNRRKAKSKPIYEGKGSTEGFSSPFQVVDMSTMSKTEANAAMEQYAETGRVDTAPKKTAPPPPPQKKLDEMEIDEIFTKLCGDVDPATIMGGEGGMEKMVSDMAALDQLLYQSKPPVAASRRMDAAGALDGLGPAPPTRAKAARQAEEAKLLAHLQGMTASETETAETAVAAGGETTTTTTAAAAAAVPAVVTSSGGTSTSSTSFKKGFLNKARATKPRVAATTPAFTIDRTAKSLAVLIELPALTSMASVALDLSSTRLKLSSPATATCPAYKLDVALPAQVDSSAARAKFKRKYHRLVVTLPLLT